MARERKTPETASDPRYNARLTKAGALLDDMRLLVRAWQPGCDPDRVDVADLASLLGKPTRSRARDTFRRAFVPRFVTGHPRDAWRLVRALEDRDVSLEVLRPVYYWITARNEPVLHDFVRTELRAWSVQPEKRITTNDVTAWLGTQLSKQGKSWSESVTTKVARSMLTTLRDFGILEGAAIKKIAPVYLPVESFAYVAFALHDAGATGAAMVNHPDWALFLLSTPAVEQMFLEADRHGLLRYQAAGRIVRIDFSSRDYKEMADVVATRAH